MVFGNLQKTWCALRSSPVALLGAEGAVATFIFLFALEAELDRHVLGGALEFRAVGLQGDRNSSLLDGKPVGRQMKDAPDRAGAL